MQLILLQLLGKKKEKGQIWEKKINMKKKINQTSSAFN